MIRRIIYQLTILLLFLSGCKSPEPEISYLFQTLSGDRTGIHFSNKLSYDQKFNLFKYIYFYNGSGLGAGDFNNDGLIDLFFGSNQGQNKIFLNNGGLQFRDVTKAAKIPDDGGWTTGISVVDINNDGLLDIYVCRVGNYETLHSKNQLLINYGISNNDVPVFIDEAAEYGLDFSGFSTQAAFFDMDQDGDLDMYLLNHSVHENGNFQPRKSFLGTYSALAGDRLFRNENTGNSKKIIPFSDVTKSSGINSSAIGYGLGVSVADVNLDGYPDLYVANDFHENDYLYINQKNGTFKDEAGEQLMHTSQFSMGVDMGDLNNDAWPEILSTDMLPADPYILKRSLSEGAYDIFQYKLEIGYNYQYTRNNLQFNRRNGVFSEIGLFSGVAATDWSWSPLLFDFDNDGYKDIFISNGIPKRLNDIDYINFVSNGDVQQKIQENNFREKDLSLIEKFPVIKIPNIFYRNNGNFSFRDAGPLVQDNAPSFSNGAIYADLDNDGDLDIVVNNIDDDAIIYQNNFSRLDDSSSASIVLKGNEKNINAIGATLFIFSNKKIQSIENYPVKGFMSSMLTPLHVGFKNEPIDSAFLVWPDHTFERVSFTPGQKRIQLSYKKDLPSFDFDIIKNFTLDSSAAFEDVTSEFALNFRHEENRFAEFDREPLIPHMFSTEGPALAVGDVNNDGLEDIFFGAARTKSAKLFLQKKNGQFVTLTQTAFEADSVYEDAAACFTDINNDSIPDLVVASGGNEFYGNDIHILPRAYLNDGEGNFTKMPDAFDSIYITASTISSVDFNGDGYNDLFISGRVVPFAYGKLPRSYLLKNDGRGHFKDVTDSIAPELTTPGFVTSSVWLDMDKDGDQDLIISQEWGGIVAYINKDQRFIRMPISEKKGWWNFILPCDVDNDGDIDFIAGNLGLNSRLKASVGEPVRMYYNDFDNNGKKEQLLTYYVGAKEIPFNSKAELEKQMPDLKKQFLYAEDFSRADISELFKPGKLQGATVFTADYLLNSVIINQGSLKFETIPLSWEAQLSTFRSAAIVYANNDSLPDILLMGNYYDNNIEMGRYDADFGTVLINKGLGRFDAQKMNGPAIKGQVRNIGSLLVNGIRTLVIARNNDDAVLIRMKKAGLNK